MFLIYLFFLFLITFSINSINLKWSEPPFSYKVIKKSMIFNHNYFYKKIIVHSKTPLVDIAIIKVYFINTVKCQN